MSDQEYVTRTEFEQFVRMYEIRHSELRLENKELETEIKAQINSLSGKLDIMATQLARRGIDAWKLVATSSASLIVGYILFYLQHILIK